MLSQGILVALILSKTSAQKAYSRNVGKTIFDLIGNLLYLVLVYVVYYIISWGGTRGCLCSLPRFLHLRSEVFISGAVYLVTSEVSLVFVAGKNQFSHSFPPPAYPGAYILCACVCVCVYMCACTKTKISNMQAST